MIWLATLLVIACGETHQGAKPSTTHGGAPAAGATSTGGSDGTSDGGVATSGDGGVATSGDGGVATSGATAGGVSGAGAAAGSEAGAPEQLGGAAGAAPEEARTPPSCAALGAMQCGAQPADCCTSLEVPGGAFPRYVSGAAAVSAFRLDKFEVTVGRFRAFVEAFLEAKPRPGTGKNPNDHKDPGWVEAWTQKLPASRQELEAGLACSATLATWTPVVGDNERRPINCVSWYEAAAFCIWDGGRLPSDMEWEHATRGGDEGRQVPWTMNEPDHAAFANYRNYCETDVQNARPECQGVAQIWNVGARPPGDGRWGHSDLAGNLWELVLDYVGPGLTCSDCARHEPYAQEPTHVARGGGYHFDLGDGLWWRDEYRIQEPGIYVGFRCARRSLE